MVALVEEYEAKEEDIEEAIESDHEDKDELCNTPKYTLAVFGLV